MVAWMPCLISEMKAMAEENRRLKRMYADVSMQNDLLKEALGKNDTAGSAPRVGRESGGDDARIQFFDFIRHGSDMPFQ